MAKKKTTRKSLSERAKDSAKKGKTKAASPKKTELKTKGVKTSRKKEEKKEEPIVRAKPRRRVRETAIAVPKRPKKEVSQIEEFFDDTPVGGDETLVHSNGFDDEESSGLSLEFGDTETDSNDPQKYYDLIKKKINGGEDPFKCSYEVLSKISDIPRFNVYKNSEYIGKFNYPFSWDYLLKKFKDGQYRVQLTSMNTGRIITSLVQLLGNPDAFNDSGDDEKATVQAPNSQSDGLPFGLDVGAIMREQATAYRELLKEKKSDERQERTMAATASQSQNTLLIETQKMNMDMMREISKSFQEQMRELKRDQLEAQKEQRQEAKENRDMMMKTIERIVDTIAESRDVEQPDIFEQLEKIEKVKKLLVPDQGSGDDWKSTLVKTIAPLAGQAAAMAAAASQQAPPVVNTQATQQRPQQPRPLPQAPLISEATKRANERLEQNKKAFPLGHIEMSEEKEKKGVKTMPRPIEQGENWGEGKVREKDWGQGVDPTTGRRTGVVEGESWRERNPQTGLIEGVPTAEDWNSQKGTKRNPTPTKPWEEVAPVQDEEWGEHQAKSSKSQAGTTPQTFSNGIPSEELKNKIMTLAIPVIAEELRLTNPGSSAAERVLDQLQGSGITALDVVRNFTLAELQGFGQQYHLMLGVDAQTASTFIKSFYDYFETTIRATKRPSEGLRVQT